MGQVCYHKHLSKQYNFRTEIRRIKNADSLFDSCIVTVIISYKNSNKSVQRIRYSSTYFFDTVFRDCNFVRSYITGKNKNVDAYDNDYGDFIVADFNFDNKDDIATKNNSGGNGGPEYYYYIQDNNGKFVVNKFLSEKMGYFPSSINKRSKTLTTTVHANVYQYGETTFKLNSKTRKLRKVRHRLLTAQE